MKTKNRDLEARLRQYEIEHEKLGDLHAELRKIREEMAKEKVQLILYEKEKDNLEEKVNALENEIERLRDINIQIENETNHWKIKYETNAAGKVDEDEELNSRNLQYIEEIETLKQIIEERDDDINIWKSEYQKLENEMNELEQKYGEEQTNQGAEKNIQDYEDALIHLKEQNEDLASTKIELENKLYEFEEIYTENESLKSTLGEIRARLKDQMEGVKNIVKRSEYELGLKKKLEEELKNKMKNSKLNIEEAEEKSEAFRINQVQQVIIENERIKRELKDKNQEIKELQYEIEEVRNENNYYTEEGNEEEEDVEGEEGSEDN